MISPVAPDQHWAVSSQRLNIFRTTNGGRTFSRASEGIDTSTAPFIAILKGCPFDEDILIAGTDRVWKATDFFRPGGPTWEANSPELASGVSALVFSPSDPGCESYAVGTLSGLINLTIDGGMSWTDVDPFGLIPARPVTDLLFDPQDSELLYAALGGFDDLSEGPFQHVFVTREAFETSPEWHNISPPIDIPVQSLAVLPQETDILYAGTDLGLWRSRDRGETWHPITPEQGFPTAAVLDLEVTPEGRMVAFTHGRGAFLKTEASQVDLSIQLEASSRTAFVDEVVNWQLRATNNGPGDTREIEVELQLHFGHALEQLPDQCVSEKEQITCHLGKLVSGQTVYLDVTTRSAQMDLLTAAASITGPAPDPVSNNDFDSLKIQVVLPRFEWFIPFFHSSPELESGIAVANLSDSDSHLLLRAFLEEGVPPLPLNPRSYLLRRHRQSTLLPREIFGEWSDSSAGWVRIRADRVQLAGFFQVFGRSSLDGGAPATEQFQQAVFTRVLQGPRAYRMLPATTHLSLANPNQEPVEVLLRLRQGPQAPLAKNRTITVEPESFLFQSVASLFEIEEADEGSVVVEVVEGPGLVGFQLIEIDGGETLIGLNPAHESTAVRLYSGPQEAQRELHSSLWKGARDFRKRWWSWFRESTARWMATSFWNPSNPSSRSNSLPIANSTFFLPSRSRLSNSPAARLEERRIADLTSHQVPEFGRPWRLDRPGTRESSPFPYRTVFRRRRHQISPVCDWGSLPTHLATPGPGSPKPSAQTATGPVQVGMKQPIASVRAGEIGRPSRIWSRAERKSCTVTIRRGFPSRSYKSLIRPR